MFNRGGTRARALRALLVGVGVLTLVIGITAELSVPHQVKAAAGINHTINFQGKVTNPDGTNVANGTYTFVFKIWNNSSAGSTLWTETQNLTVTSGIFQVDLGAVTSLPGSVDFNSDSLYLSMNFNGDGDMNPRIHFDSVPQAFNSEKLNGLSSNQFLRSDTASTLDTASTTAFVLQNTSSNQLFVADTTNAKVGIGAAPTSSGATLQVTGTISSSGAISVGATGDTSLSNTQLTIGGVVVCTASGCGGVAGGSGDVYLANDQTLTGKNTFTGSGNGTAVGTLFKNASNSTSAFAIQTASGSTDLLVADTTNARIGINTNTPGYTLDVGGDINTTGEIKINGVTVCTASGCSGVAGGAGDVYLASNQTFTGYNTFKNTTNSTTAFQIQNAAGTTNLFVADTANNVVGIGALPTPSGSRLQVSGSISASSNIQASGTLTTSGGTLSTFATTGNLFNTVATTLNVGGAATAVNIGASTGTTTVNNGLTVNGGGLFKNAADSTTAFQIQNSAGTSNLLVANTTASQIGIGKAPSQYTLDVNGTIGSSSQIYAGVNLTFATASATSGYISHVMVAGTGGVGAQDVVVLNSSGQMVDTTTYRDPRVIGVSDQVTAASGNGYLVTSGNHYVKVDTGAVNVGDQLVTSTTSGMATVDNNATSGIVGVALTSKTAGSAGNVGAAINVVRGQNATTFRNTTDSTTAFQVQNAAGAAVFDVNTANTSVGIGAAGSGTVKLYVTSGNYIGQVINQTGSFDILNLQNSGTNVATVSSTGATLFKNSTDSATAFQIQNSAGTSNLFIADTTNSRIGIGKAPTQGALDVNGAIYSAGLTASGGISTTSTITAGSSISTNSNFVLNASNGAVTHWYTVDANGVSQYDVLVQNSDGTVGRSATARDKRIFGIAVSTVAAGNPVSVALIGNFQVNADTAAVSIGDQLVVSSTSGKVTVDNNATTGILGIATSAKTAGSAGQVGVYIAMRQGQYSPVFRNTTDSTTAFQIQNAAGTSNLFTADTTNSRVAVAGLASAATHTLEVTGDINASSNIYINGVAVCTVTACAASNGSNNFINNGTTLQAGNFNIQSPNTAVPAAQIRVATGQSTGNVFEIQNSSGTALSAFDAFGKLFVPNLNVSNNAQITGTITLGFANANSGQFQKLLTTSTAVTAGDVVVMTGNNNPTCPTCLMLVGQTTTARDPRVYGVAASTAASSANTYVTILGNTTVNVDTAAVAVGDQLVTSSTAGRATADNNATTGIIGYALTTKAAGSVGSVAITVRPTTGQSTPRFQPTTDSTTAFQIQNAAGTTNLFTVDSTNGKVGIGAAPSSTDATLQVTGDIKSTTSLYAGAAGNYYLKSTGNFKSANITDNGSGATTFSGSGNGSTRVGSLFQNSTDSTTSFQIQNATGTSNLFMADTTNSKIGIGMAPASNGASLQVSGTAYFASAVSLGLTTCGAGAAKLCVNTAQVGEIINQIGSSDILQLQNNGTIVADVNATGAAYFKNSTDSTVAFKIQNAAGTSNLFIADTTNTRIGIGVATPAYTLDVAGDINTTGTIRVNGTALASTNLSDSSNLAKLNATNLFTGTISVKPANQVSAFAVVNAASAAILNVNTADSYVINNGTKAIGNELENPGFEAGGSYSSTGWNTDPADNRVIVTNDSTNAHSGNNYLSTTAISSPHDTSTSKYYAVTPGDQVYFEGWYKTTVGADGVGGMILQFMDKDKLNPSYTGNNGGAYSAATSTWTYISMTATVPAGKYYVRPTLTVRNTATTGTWYFDDIYFSRVTNQAPVVYKNGADSTTAFQIQNAAGTSNLFVADTTNGRIGIGMTPVSNGSTLQVSGSINASSYISSPVFIATNYNKNFTTGGAVNASDVVVLNSSNQVVQTTTARDPRVAGVAVNALASGQTEQVVIGGGYVVNADTAAIAVGDQLVTSSTAGRVTADNNATTGILGYAMTSKAAGSTGTVTARIQLHGGQYTPKFQNATDSTSAFQIQNAAGTSNLLVADTTNNRIAVGQATANYTLDVAGTINATTGITINGVAVCTVSTCTGGGGSYINNGTTMQTGNINIQSGSGSNIAAVIQGASSQTVDIFEVKDGASNLQFGVNQFGNTYVGTANSVGGKFSVSAGGSTNRGIVVKGGASQTGDLQQFISNSNVLLLSITAAGALQGGNASGTDTSGLALALNGGQGTGTGAGGAINFNIFKPSGTSGSTNNTTTSTVATLDGTTGAALFKNATDSTTAFQIQNATATSNLLIADTTNSKVGIGVAPTSTLGQLQIGAAGANTTTSGITFGADASATLYRSNSAVIATSGGFLISGNNQINGTLQGGGLVGFGTGGITAGQQLSVGLSSASNKGIVVKAAASQTADLLQVTNNSGGVMISVSSAGALQGGNATGTNVAGTSLALNGGQGTGTGNGGDVVINIFKPGSSGSSNNTTATAALTISGNDGSATFKPATDSTSAFKVQNSTGGNLIVADTINSYVGINMNNASPQVALDVNGALALRGTAMAQFTTPANGTVASKIYIPLFDLGQFTQMLSFGVTAGSDSSARALAAFDGRTSAHQPTIAVFNPSETDAFGFSWDGGDSIAYLKSLGANIGIRAGNTNLAQFLAAGTNVLYGQDSGWNDSISATLAVGKSTAGGSNRSIAAAGSINANGADYAEWIPWSGTHPAAGSVVSYKGSSYVVSSTETAAFVGNDKFGDGSDSILVTFAGQVPVRTTGVVHIGDLLIPNGDGTAHAVTSSTATIGEVFSKVAIAQEASDDTGVKMIAAAVGTTSDSIGQALQNESATFSSVTAQGGGSFGSLNVSGHTTLSGLTVNGDADITGTLTVTKIAATDIEIDGHIVTGGHKPTVAVQTAAGQDAQVSIDGNDVSGTITIQAGPNAVAGDLVKLTFTRAYGRTPHIVISPSNDDGADLPIYRGATTTTDVMFRTKGTPHATKSYQYDYFITETKEDN